jgi:hypothetical protein
MTAACRGTALLSVVKHATIMLTSRGSVACRMWNGRGAAARGAMFMCNHAAGDHAYAEGVPVYAHVGSKVPSSRAPYAERSTAAPGAGDGLMLGLWGCV